jgi:threonylcarbamoyladenosine tRNA methylthiotransferase MtaB
MLSAAVCTLGCKLNQLESEALAGAFKQAGFAVRSGSDSCAGNILVVNTCTVTSKADQKARRLIRKALRDNPNSCVLVTGCYAQLASAEIQALEAECNPKGNVNERRLFVLKGDEKSALLDLPRYLNDAGADGAGLSALVGKWAGGRNGAFYFAPEQFSFHTRGFLKIQDGCDKHCTYCRVRLARGRSVSLGAEKVLAELRRLEENGYVEAVLVGVNITQYRDAAAESLEELVEYLLAGTQNIALRLTSLEPDSISEQFAGVLSHKRIRPHFHLSVQSGSEKILKKMGRTYGPETVEQAVKLLRSVKDDPFLACDIITGFPGETEAEFEKTRALCQQDGFAWIHVFPYSKRPGTPAYSFPQPVCEKEAAKRAAALTDLAKHGRQDYVRRWLGREVEVLVEKGTTAQPSCCRGVSDNYLKLLVHYAGTRAPRPGVLLRRRIKGEQDKNNFNEDYDAAAEELPENF